MGPAKLQKAQKLGVAIISEEEFMEMIGGAGCSAPHLSHRKRYLQGRSSTPISPLVEVLVIRYP